MLKIYRSLKVFLNGSGHKKLLKYSAEVYFKGDIQSNNDAPESKLKWNLSVQENNLK